MLLIQNTYTRSFNSLTVPPFLRPSLSLQAHHPIDLVYNELHPQYNKSITYFLRCHPRLKSLALTFTHVKQIDNLCSPRTKSFPALTSLSLKLRGCADKAYLFDEVEKDDEEDEAEENFWSWSLKCPNLRRLKLGRGKWDLRTVGFKSLSSLTLKHMDWSYVDLKNLGTVTPRLTEFVLYHSWDLDRPSSGPGGGGTFTFDLSNAQTVRFYFPHNNLTLSLTLSRSLTTFSAMAKQLVLTCKSTELLALHHLSLYGQQRLVISSLHLASVRVAYLNSPPKDHHARNDESSSYLDSPVLSHEISPDRENVHCRSSAAFSWAEWLAPIAPTVEVLIAVVWKNNCTGLPDAVAAGKKAYVIAIKRRITPEKLANFPDAGECDVLVLVACAEGVILDDMGQGSSGSGGGSSGSSGGGSRAFYAPVVTPFEALMALEEGWEWTGEYRMLLDGAGVVAGGSGVGVRKGEGGSGDENGEGDGEAPAAAAAEAAAAASDQYLAVRRDMALSTLPVLTDSLALARASGQSGYATSAAVEARSGSDFLALRRDCKGLEVVWLMAPPGGTPRATPWEGGGDARGRGHESKERDEGGREDGGVVCAFMPRVGPSIDEQ
ncbi:unnamed protein product [Closterium sp. NIES-64]|nr:unnamed protein product [Closterium sp. NIES-64]